MIADAASTVTLDANTIILAIISLAGTCVTGFLALRMATVAAEAKENKAATVKAAEGIEKIHVAVNSGKTAMEDQIKNLNKTVLELSGTIKTLEENKRGAELAKAVSEVKPAMVTPATATPSAGPHSTLKEAIVDLTEAAKDTVVSAEETVTQADKIPRT